MDATLKFIKDNFTRHGGDCFHFHRNGTACLNKKDHPDAITFQVYRWNHPLSMSDEGIYWPYFLDERAIIGWLKYEVNREG